MKRYLSDIFRPKANNRIISKVQPRLCRSSTDDLEYALPEVPANEIQIFTARERGISIDLLSVIVSGGGLRFLEGSGASKR